MRELRAVFEGEENCARSKMARRGLEVLGHGHATPGLAVGNIRTTQFHCVTNREAINISTGGMSLVHASRHVACRGTCLRTSYAEISPFFRTRHHGITPVHPATCSRTALRSFTSSQSTRNSIEPSETLRKTLDDYKATSMSTSRSCSLKLNPLQFALMLGTNSIGHGCTPRGWSPRGQR